MLGSIFFLVLKKSVLAKVIYLFGRPNDVILLRVVDIEYINHQLQMQLHLLYTITKQYLFHVLLSVYLSTLNTMTSKVYL